jgi:molecular chaperone GrpE (heat shock protein)
LQQCQERERRAQADYQNLVRRTQEERVRLVALANADLLEALLQPLDHLELAAQQLKDTGLNMVLSQFKNTLSQFGLEQIAVEGQKFDVTTMEVIERKSETGETVMAVAAPGYRLNGQVFRHAKVVIG